MYKTNRVNHDFQILNFLMGACHTPDAAYALLCDLQDERKMALAGVITSDLKRSARIVKFTRQLDNDDEVLRLEAQAEISEATANQELNSRNIAAATAELSFIEKCKDKLEPYRKYSHLSLAEAHQAAQQEEWKLELIYRAENCMLTTGTISTDHFSTMRLHPEFTTAILPAIQESQRLLQRPDGITELSNRAKTESVLQEVIMGISNEINPLLIQDVAHIE